MTTVASFVSVLKTCESASGAGSKQIIKEALGTLDEFGQTLFKYAMDPFIVFGVKKFDMPTPSGTYQPSSTDYHGDKFLIKLFTMLANRELTGNAARAAVTSTLAEYTADTAKYLARIIDKDLQAGFSAETFNKIFPKNPVPVFNVMLADKCTTEEEFESISFPCIADVKYDGARHVVIAKIFYVVENDDGSVMELSGDDRAELDDGTMVSIKSLMVGAEVRKYHRTSGDQHGKMDKSAART